MKVTSAVKCLCTKAFVSSVYNQWRNNRACSARGPSAVGGPKFARRCFFGDEGALLEYLHAGPLQPCYATVYNVVFRTESRIVQFISLSYMVL